MIKYLFCFGSAFLFFSFSFSQTKTWLGPNANVWNDANNWSPAGIPAATDTVIFDDFTKGCTLSASVTVAAMKVIGTGARFIGSGSITTDNSGDASPALFVASGATLSLGNSGSIAMATYSASGLLNNARIDGIMTFGSNSAWTVNNGAAITNVTVSGIIRPVMLNVGLVLTNSTSATVHFLNGSTLDWTRSGGVIPNADYQDGSIININPSGPTSTILFGPAANYNGLLIWNCPSQTTTGAGAVLLPTGSTQMDSVRIVSTGTGTLRLRTEPAGFILQHLEVQGGTLEISSPQTANGFGTINNLVISGGLVIGNATFSTDIFSAGAYPMALTINEKLTVTGGILTLTNRPLAATVAPGGACSISVGGDVLQTGGTITTNTDFGVQNYISLHGVAPQDLNMVTFSGPMALEINNPAGVTLSGNLTIPSIVSTVPSTLNLVNGIITPVGANLLTIAAGAVVSGASNASFVNGKVKKIGNTAFMFPVGSANGTFTGYVPVEISATAGTATDNFTAAYKRATAEAYPINNVGIEHVSRADHWILDRAGSILPVNVTFYWTAQSSSGGSSNYINNLQELIVAWCNGTDWVNFSGMGTYGTSTQLAGSLTWTGLTNTFGPFSFASTTINNPLPINLNYLNGVRQGSSNYIDWKVTCTNNPTATMSLERSADSRNFTGIAIITADALRCQQPFDYTDNQPLSGMNYYRLKMTDANGKITYSSIIAILNKATGFDIVGLYPTMVSSHTVLNVAAAQRTKMEVMITDITGRQVKKIAYSLIAGSNQFVLNLSNLSAGTYQISGYTNDGQSKTIRFVKQ